MSQFINLKTMGEDDLLNRQIELTKRIVSANSAFMDFQIIEQLEIMLDAVISERQERSVLSDFESNKDQLLKVNDTDEVASAKPVDKIKSINDIPANLKQDDKVDRLNERQVQYQNWQKQMNQTKQVEIKPKRGRPRGSKNKKPMEKDDA